MFWAFGVYIYDDNLFRAMVDLGCITMVERGKAKQLAGQDIDTFDLDWLQVILQECRITSFNSCLSFYSVPVAININN